uniref:Uncharacterized protein n=1 Tax=Romanomermis culicivorax TaxID=13658 RepID=A0A915HG49_ROMCU
MQQRSGIFLLFVPVPGPANQSGSYHNHPTDVHSYIPSFVCIFSQKLDKLGGLILIYERLFHPFFYRVDRSS